MPLTPENAPGSEPRERSVLTGELPARRANWTAWLRGIAFAGFAFGVGLFLMFFPWMDTWNLNYFQASIPTLRDIWDDPYFRGVFTGVGILNIYVGCRQVIGLLRRS
jgi:hypothetical protein